MSKTLKSDNIKTIKDENIKFFSSLVDQHEDEHKIVAKSKISHLKRFQKILDLGDFPRKKVLDVGCGLAGLYSYMREKGIDADYTGLDINDKMIAKAQKMYPEIQHKLLVCDILEDSWEEEFDYVVSVGPLNLKFEGSLNMSSTVQLMRKMFDLWQIGFAISMTSSLTNKPHDDTFYYAPSEILTETMAFCPNVRFDHTYLPHDFTLFGYKKNLYDF